MESLPIGFESVANELMRIPPVHQRLHSAHRLFDRRTLVTFVPCSVGDLFFVHFTLSVVSEARSA